MKLRTDLAFFSTLVKCGSSSAAALEFNVTPSAVSKWLAQLNLAWAFGSSRATRDALFHAGGRNLSRRRAQDSWRDRRSGTQHLDKPGSTRSIIESTGDFRLWSQFHRSGRPRRRRGLWYPAFEIQLFLTGSPGSVRPKATRTSASWTTARRPWSAARKRRTIVAGFLLRRIIRKPGHDRSYPTI